jgi:release factor glutamine methyltransferase
MAPSGGAVAGRVGEALAAATDALAAAGVERPRLDAELLLAAATGTGRARLISRPEGEIPAAEGRRFGELVRRRVRREPVAYILGRKGFRRIELSVDRRVLIPRPETELLVDVALELEPATVLDVGTGSGAVALAIADELPRTAVVATDTSLEALALARSNALRLGLSERVRLEPGTLPAGEFDLLVANLPYVSEAEWRTLEPELREHEPLGALVAGASGLEAIEALLGQVAVAASRPAAIALEVGAAQAGTVGELVRRAGFERVDLRQDLAGIERVVLGR